MEYHTSIHYQDDPLLEVASALDAGNPPESIQATLTARLMVEQHQHARSNTEAIERINQQLKYLGSLGLLQPSP